MGIATPQYFTYKSSPLKVSELYTILKDRLDSNTQQNDGEVRKMPTVDIDANQLAFEYKTMACGPVSGVFTVALLFSHLGINLCIVCDPQSRHHSKRATTPIERKGNSERARLECIELQAQLALKLQSDNRPTDEEKADFH